MPPARAWTDEYTLLCERCGYVVEGLDPSGNCPECGKAIAQSLPERRVGTAWQRSPTFRGLTKTWWRTIKRPRETLDMMSIDPESAERLFGWTVVACGIVAFVGTVSTLGASWAAKGRIDSTRESLYWGVTVAQVLGTGLFSALIVPAAAGLLTFVERQGLGFFGSRRSFRMTSTIARATCAHGAVGWLLATAVVSIGGLTQVWSTNIGGVVIFVGFIAGFLFFETFAYLGLRRCKYANRSRPGADASGSSLRADETHQPGASPHKEPGA